MRLLHMAAVVLSIMVLTGCPSEFGKDGRVSKATAKDAQENLLMIKRCSTERRREVCANGQQNSAACLECGGPP